MDARGRAMQRNRAFFVRITSTGYRTYEDTSPVPDKVNKKHAEMTAQGWRFADLEIYTEDGDMQGAFVTYERD